MSDSLTILGEDYTGVTGIKATDTTTSQTITFIHPAGSKSITENGTDIDVAVYATVDVAVATGTPRTSSNVHISGKTVTVDPGLYSEEVSKSVADGSATTPATTITANPTISVATSGANVGRITASVSTSQNVTPTVSEGYVTSGTATAGTITVNGSATSQLTVCGDNDVDFDSSELYVYGPSGYYPSGFAYEVPAMTLPTAASSTSSGASKATISSSTSTRYINIPTGYNNAASYYQLNPPSAMTLPTAASGTASGTTKATISRSTSDQYINIPTGYNSAAANYKVNATPNGTVVPQASISATGASVSHSSTTLTLSKSNVSNTPNVTTEGYISAGTAGNSTLSLSATDSNFVAGNIKDGVSIFGLTGSYTGGTPNLQAKTNISPTTSSQTISADTGYDGLSSVQINAMPTQSLPTTASSTATGTRKATIASSTSTQYINIPTGYNSAAAYYQLSAPTAMTLPTTTSSTSSGDSKLAVTPGMANKYINIPTGYNSAAAYYTVNGDANLVAGNIKDGTTIFGVTGSYEGGGGGSVQFDTKTATASNYPVSLAFTSMKGEPKAFVLRLNAAVSSSGSTTYYYIVDISHFGTTTHGNCFRIGSTRRVDNITSGYSFTYSGTTLTVTSSAASRSASPGAFYSGSYELLYCY